MPFEIHHNVSIPSCQNISYIYTNSCMFLPTKKFINTKSQQYKKLHSQFTLNTRNR